MRIRYRLSADPLEAFRTLEQATVIKVDKYKANIVNNQFNQKSSTETTTNGNKQLYQKLTTKYPLSGKEQQQKSTFKH